MIFDHWIKARVTGEQKEKYIKLGGSAWLRGKIEEASEISGSGADRQVLVVDEPDCGALETLVRENI